jgi:hypothetical protein
MKLKHFNPEKIRAENLEESAARDATQALKDRGALRKSLDALVFSVENFTFSGGLDPDRDSFNEGGAVRKAQKILADMDNLVKKMESIARRWPD